jgi:diguanylate cyclase (GGDEF)-like protein
LSGLVIGGYGLLLHRAGLLETVDVLTLPALLCLTLVYLSKISIAQAEMQRIADNEEQSRKESMSDALTGLPNRAQFLERVARSVKCGQHNREFHFAFFFVDLVGLKPINDRLGHKAGDAVLRHTATLFQGCLRKGDVVARYGGDEFTFLINNVKGPGDAIHVAERILAKIEAPINVGEPVKVGASIGIALSTNIHERAEDLIRDADGAMYQAKGRGKKCYVLSDQASTLPKSEAKERWKRLAQLQW